MYLLEVLSGPLDGKTWTFESEITIGRDDSVAEACIALDRYVSRKHAHLRVDGGTLQHALEARRRFCVLDVIGNEVDELVIDISRQIAA